MIIIDNYFVHKKLYDVCYSTRDEKSFRKKREIVKPENKTPIINKLVDGVPECVRQKKKKKNEAKTFIEMKEKKSIRPSIELPKSVK